jgi:hypothetical protein
MHLMHHSDERGAAPNAAPLDDCLSDETFDAVRERPPQWHWDVTTRGARCADILIEPRRPMPALHDFAWITVLLVIEGELEEVRQGMVIRIGEAVLSGRLAPPSLVARRWSRLALFSLPWSSLPEPTRRSVPERTPTLLRHALGDLDQLARIGRNARGIGAVLGRAPFGPIEDGLGTTMRTLVRNVLRTEGLPGLEA